MLRLTTGSGRQSGHIIEMIEIFGYYGQIAVYPMHWPKKTRKTGIYHRYRLSIPLLASILLSYEGPSRNKRI